MKKTTGFVLWWIVLVLLGVAYLWINSSWSETETEFLATTQSFNAWVCEKNYESVDYDNDGHITSDDVAFILGVVEGVNTCPVDKICDANRDGVVDEKDVKIVYLISQGTPIDVCGDGVDNECNGTMDDNCNYTCGNGVLEPGEECDDGNNFPGDGCSELCGLEVQAWLGVDKEGEYDFANNPSMPLRYTIYIKYDGVDLENPVVVDSIPKGTCYGAIGVDPAMGSEFRFSADHRETWTDVPSAEACKVTDVKVLLGEGFVEAHKGQVDLWLVEDPNNHLAEICNEATFSADNAQYVEDIDCVDGFPMSMCGNGITEPGEECDDGNMTNGDGCDVNCIIESN